MVYGSSIGRSLQPVVGETILDTSDLSINMKRDIDDARYGQQEIADSFPRLLEQYSTSSLKVFRIGKSRRGNEPEQQLQDFDVISGKLGVLFGLWSFYFTGGLIGIYMDSWRTFSQEGWLR